MTETARIITSFLTFGLVVLIPVYLCALFCSARTQRNASIALTLCYGVLSAAYFSFYTLMGWRAVDFSRVEDFLAAGTMPLWLGAIWLIHFAKMHIARQHGWWGASDHESDRGKSRGFPVIPKQNPDEHTRARRFEH